MKVTVLVTGGAGFIGSHLTEALVRRGEKVRVLDNLSEGRMRNLQAVRKKIEFVRGDLRDPVALKRALRGVRAVYHQAALRSVPKSVGKPFLYHEVNTNGTLLLFRLAKEAGVKRVVYASSSSVYGDGVPIPQRESARPAPQSPYAVSKLATEYYGSLFSRLYGLETVGLRYFNVFGPRQSLENQYAVVVPKFITSLLKGEHPPIHGDGKQTRDFTYVENVVRANLRAGRSPRVSGEVFNIATGSRCSVAQLSSRLNRILGTRIRPKFLPKRPGDVLHTGADISKARRLLGFRVEVTLDEGLRRTARWFDENRSFWK